MFQNAIHPVVFKTNVVNVEHMKHRDCARAKHLVAGHQPHGPDACHKAKKGHHHQSGCADPSTSINVKDSAVTYLATVAIGSPATNCELLIDTGSSNTWCLKPPFKETSTTKDTRQKFQIQYGSGSCSGTLCMDQVALGPKLVIKDQCIGVADQADQMDGIDGILGIGPAALTEGTTSDNASVPTVTDNCIKQGLIGNECIGIYYEPTTTTDAPNGYLSFGGPDSSKYTDNITYVPITKTSPACNYWGYDQSICYGGKEIMPMCAGIADTGTTLVMLPSDTFNAYKAATGATLDKATGLLCLTQDQYDCMQSMVFNIGGMQCELTKNAQIWPRSMNSTLGGQGDKIYSIFADMGPLQNDGLCFINGFTFLQRFYSVYDTTNSQLGFATTQHTMATTN
ncbi:acid protease [Mycena capillaripes]|nr:acid protease [Mycena capillaripes]